jgi:hypothetical protein
MAYAHTSKKSGTTYYLHERVRELKGGKTTSLFYFGKEAKAGAIDKLPDGYKVVESEKTGLPMLKKA